MRPLEVKPWQMEVIEKVYKQDLKKQILAMDAGTGKTVVGLILIGIYKPERTLIITRPVLVDNAWGADNRDLCDPETGKPAFQYNMILLDSEKIRNGTLREPGVYVCSYEIFLNYAEDYFKKYRWDMVLLDESHAIANRGSHTSKAVCGVSRAAGRVNMLEAERLYCLTGSLRPNRDEQVFPQLVSVGYTSSWTSFKQRYFWEHPRCKFSVLPNPYMADALKDLIAKYSLVVKKGDTDLGDIEKEYFTITFQPEERVLRVQKELIKNGVYQDHELDVSVDFKIAEPTALRRIAKGSVENDNGMISQIDNNAYAMFKDFVSVRAKEEPLIVWYFFREELDRLTKAAQMAGIEHFCALTGGMDKDERNAIVSAFQQAEDGILFIQYQVGKNGLTFTNVHSMIFFSMIDDAECFGQAQDRIHRIGQEADAVHYYMFIGNGTIDEVIWKSLKKKENCQEALKNWIKEVRK